MSKDHPADTIIAGLSWFGGTAATWLINNALGIVVGLGGLAIQAFFNYRKDKRDQRRLQLEEQKHGQKDGQKA